MGLGSFNRYGGGCVASCNWVMGRNNSRTRSPGIFGRVFSVNSNSLNVAVRVGATM
jgi:hypothetical protein